MSVWEKLDEARSAAAHPATEPRPVSPPTVDPIAAKKAAFEQKKTAANALFAKSGTIAALQEVASRIPGAEVRLVADEKSGEVSANVTWRGQQRVFNYQTQKESLQPRTFGITVKPDGSNFVGGSDGLYVSRTTEQPNDGTSHYVHLQAQQGLESMEGAVAKVLAGELAEPNKQLIGPAVGPPEPGIGRASPASLSFFNTRIGS